MPIIPYVDRVNYVGKAGLFFHHIPKCGGLSLTQMLRPCFASSCGVHHNVLSKEHVNFAADFFYGHGVMGLEAYVPKEKNFYYSTFLRHPFALAKSLLQFSKWLFPREKFFQKAHEDALLRIFPVKNMLIHYLGQGDAFRAEAVLFEQMAFYGIQEYFSASVQMFTELIPQLAMQDIVVKNVSAPQKTHMDCAIKEAFYEQHAADIALYEKAEREFMARASAASISIDKKDMSLHEKACSQEIELSTDFAKKNKQNASLQTVAALRHAIFANEDIFDMDACSQRFENWLHILLHSLDTKEEYAIFFQWLMQRMNRRPSCLFFAFYAAYKGQLPEQMLVAKHLFALCNACDKHNTVRVLIQCRLDIISTMLWQNEYKKPANVGFYRSCLVWLKELENAHGIDHPWQRISVAMQNALVAHVAVNQAKQENVSAKSLILCAQEPDFSHVFCIQNNEQISLGKAKNYSLEKFLSYEFLTTNVYFVHML